MTTNSFFDTHMGYRQSAHAMRIVFFSVFLIVALGACGSKATDTGAATGAADREWVCRPDGDAWACDEGAAARPVAESDAG